MKKYCKTIFLLFFMLSTFYAIAQKKVVASYYGGHSCYDMSLELYENASFLFEQSYAIPFPHSSKKRGCYYIIDSSITMYKKIQLHLLKTNIVFKYQFKKFRIDNGNILLYPIEEEQDSDANFTKDYNTLWLSKAIS
jgi:hypothetical protein